MGSNDIEVETKYKGVGGWLRLLCFIFTVCTPLLTLYALSASYKESHLYFNRFPGLQAIFYIDSFLCAILIILSIRAGIALWRIKPRAVKIAKNYLLFYLVFSIIEIFLPFFAGLPQQVNEAMIPMVLKVAVQSITFFGIWYSYLSFSKRVKITYNSSL